MEQTDYQNLPKHIAIIMDGNGRWAKMRHLDRTQGHAEGIKRVEEIVETAREMGIKALTLYTFSTENWNRPETEVAVLMNMLTSVIKKKIQKLKENNIRFQMIGREDRIPNPVLDAIKMAVKETHMNTGLVVNLAFNYGSRIEIIDAIKKISASVLDGRLKIDDINEETVNQFLYTHGLPDPDLLIRTSGEKRISNFLLWQLSYAEFYFIDIFWPDFDKEEFKKAIVDFQARERRFGNLMTHKR